MTFRRLLAGYGSSLLNIFSGLLTTLWLLRVVATEISPEDFGRYNLILQAVGYLAIVQLGLDFAVCRTVAEKLAAGDDTGARRSYFQLRRFNRWSALFVSLATIIGTTFVWFFTGNKSFVTMVGLMGFSQVIQFLARTPAAALIGSQQQVTVNIVSVMRSVFHTVLAYFMIRQGVGVESLVIGDVLSQVAYGVTISLFSKSKCPWLVGDVLNPSEGFKELVKYGAVTALGGIAWTIEAGADVFLLKWVPNGGGLVMVTVYVLWWRFPQMAFTVCSNLSMTAFPGFAATHTNLDVVKVLFRKVVLVSTAITCVMIVGIGIWLTPFIRLWVGEKYLVEDGPRLALLMALLVAFRTYGNIVSMFWMATGKAGWPTVLCWIQAIVKILLSVFFIEHEGIYGLLIASVLSIMFQIFGIGFPLYRKGIFSRMLVLTIAIPVSIAVVTAHIIGPMMTTMDIYRFVFGVSLTGILAAVSASIWLKFLGVIPSFKRK